METKIILTFIHFVLNLIVLIHTAARVHKYKNNAELSVLISLVPNWVLIGFYILLLLLGWPCYLVFIISYAIRKI